MSDKVIFGYILQRNLHDGQSVYYHPDGHTRYPSKAYIFETDPKVYVGDITSFWNVGELVLE